MKLCSICSFFLVLITSHAIAQSDVLTLNELREIGAQKTAYKNRTSPPDTGAAPKADLEKFKQTIRPLLKNACFDCHGPDLQEGNIRIDTLNPDLLLGKDRAWWIEIFDVLSKGEMPPADADELPATGRSQIVDWLSHELQVASQVARTNKGHSSFRRMTRYEYNYALQDLLGLPFNFVEDLPPETPSEDGFLNSSEMLQISASQFETYREIARRALLKATFRGEQPEPVYYSITMEASLSQAEKRFAADIKKLEKRFADKPEKLAAEIEKRRKRRPGGAHYLNTETGAFVQARWGYSGAKYAHKPVDTLPEIPDSFPNVAVIPAGKNLIIDLGDHLPATGNLRLRLRSFADVAQADHVASLRVHFGHQASNNSAARERVGTQDLVITGRPSQPEFYEFVIPLSEVVRNPFRGIQKLGKTPNPAEYVMLENTSGTKTSIQFDYVEIIAPWFATWPPESHRNVFGPRFAAADEGAFAEVVISRFMKRAWRRKPTESEVEQKLKLFERLRPQCETTEDAIVEVLASVLSSPKFLYLVRSETNASQFEMATRLAMFLWSSLPDDELLKLAANDQLADPAVLESQVNRMLDDSRGQRFARHFVRQWLGMELLDHQQIDADLRAAMHEEPVAFFRHLLQENHSVLDFLHADYTLLNEKLARHYGVSDVYGGDFRRVAISPELRRGGLLTQAGLLAMNSDGKDSHPLKRGIWLLESLLNDPPPPPPPAVPEIDLTDPNILKLTLKERMEDHRNDAACRSCHQRIDPWGIAFENYDALGRWRTKIGKKPVDASSELFNNYELRGMDGLKRYLLANRQDQFARAIAHKLTAYALGRPLGFADRAGVDSITAKLRQEGDGLRTLIHLIVKSELFRPQNRH